MKDWTDQVLQMLALDQAADASIDVFSPFFQDQAKTPAAAVAGVWLHAWASASSNPSRAHQELEGTLRGFMANANVPSRAAGSRSLVLPEPTAASRGDQLDYQALYQISHAASSRAVSLLNAAIQENGWTSRDLYVTIDGRLRPHWGTLSHKFKRTSDDIERLSSAARWASYAMRNKKYSIQDKQVNATVQKWSGTFWGHEWLHLTVHHYRTRESFPIAVLFRFGNKEEELRLATRALAGVCVSPHAILVDKEFSGSYAGLQALREYADPRGVFVIGPVKRQEPYTSMMQQAWDSGKARFVKDAQETLYFACERRTSESVAKGHPHDHHVAFVYTLAELRADLREELEPQYVYSEPGKEIFGMGFYSNLEVRHENARWFAGIYARRWACEALFMRHITMMGQSQSCIMETKHFGYVGAFLLLSVYGHWRVLRRKIDGHLKAYPDELSHATFMSLLKGGLLRQYLT